MEGVFTLMNVLTIVFTGILFILRNLYFRYKGFLDTVEIVMNKKNGCEKYPYMDMDEHCKL